MQRAASRESGDRRHLTLGAAERGRRAAAVISTFGRPGPVLAATVAQARDGKRAWEGQGTRRSEHERRRRITRRYAASVALRSILPPAIPAKTSTACCPFSSEKSDRVRLGVRRLRRRRAAPALMPHARCLDSRPRNCRRRSYIFRRSPTATLPSLALTVTTFPVACLPACSLTVLRAFPVLLPLVFAVKLSAVVVQQTL